LNKLFDWKRVFNVIMRVATESTGFHVAVLAIQTVQIASSQANLAVGCFEIGPEIHDSHSLLVQVFD